MQAAAEEQVGALRRCSHQELTYALSPLLPTRHPRTEYQHGRPHRPPIRPQKTLLEPLNAWGPICDGVMVSTDWRNDAKCGYLNGNGGQGIVVGWTVDEGSMYTLQLLDPEILKREILKSNAHNHETIRHLYDLEHVDSEHHASAVASAYIGDSLFHANILSLVHRLANDPLSPPTHAQCYALRTSPPALMATTNAAEVIGEYFGCMHTGDVPYAFGFDGTEPHTRHPGDVYGVAVGAPPSAPPRLGTPFQAHELELCQRLMGSWGAFIRGEGMQDWPTVQSMRSIGPQKEVSLEQLPVLALGDAAQIGDANGSGSRDVMVKMLGELAFWRSVVMPGAATVKERIEWWSHSEVRFLECYGRADYNEM
ncbi:hypothetical protein K437DRAFT_75589 [Tilletiaria anomala UBC 951]|uniref:Carboxylesterase type B domain-containing protein n=1 Tax=Tilletiaria anomala (strain ATCC 24038 / CBS 436.72 / UBC 951) TaxID=1037660 RepID=A0A066V9V7_TILAU|nr:uncharacterized protein K437DRAFT_75589 [Tilletiaria anomala UBC 951]KDN35549.1 hypothetical protein K437DRAFT_75589 [Tilletiaria anomala UBC 951]